MSDLPGYFLLLSYCMYFNGYCFNDYCFNALQDVSLMTVVWRPTRTTLIRRTVCTTRVSPRTPPTALSPPSSRNDGVSTVPRPCNLILVSGKFTQCKCPRFLSLIQAVLTTTNATSPPGRRPRTAPPTAAAERRAPSPSSTPVL